VVVWNRRPRLKLPNSKSTKLQPEQSGHSADNETKIRMAIVVSGMWSTKYEVLSGHDPHATCVSPFREHGMTFCYCTASGTLETDITCVHGTGSLAESDVVVRTQMIPWKQNCIIEAWFVATKFLLE